MADLGIVGLGNWNATFSVDVMPVGASPLQLIGNANDASYVHDTANTSHTGVGAMGIDDVPDDFVDMDTLSVQLRYGLSAAAQNNSWDQLTAQIYRSDGVTPLTDEVVVAVGPITNTTPINSAVIPLTGIDVTADKNVWRLARCHLRFYITKNKGGDEVEERVSAAELTGTYTPVASPLVTSVTYWTNPGTNTITGPWADMPENLVLWVDINYGDKWHRRLMGRDHYWVDPATLRYGVFNEPDNADWYGDAPPVAWEVSEAGETDLGAITPAGVRILNGVYIPNSEAIALDIIDEPDAPKP